MRQSRILVFLVTMLLTMMVFIPSYQAPNTNNPIENRDDCVVLINESFENGFPPEDWTNIDWLYSYHGEPYHGDHWVSSASFGATLTTFPIEFGINTTLTFWYRTDYSNIPLELEVYVNDTLVWYDYDFMHYDYEMATVNLNSFSGLKTISFYNLGNKDGPLWINLDLITVTTSTFAYVDDDFNSSTPGWQIDHFDVIQDGIDAVPEGGTVYVYNGTYYENVIVNKTIDLIGEDRNNTIIENTINIEAITVSANNVKISNFLVNNTDQNDVGVQFFQSDWGIIQNITIVHCTGHPGIIVKQSDNISVFNNVVTRCGNGLSIVSSDHTFVKKNHFFSNDYYGIYSSDSIFTNISNNVIIHNSPGIYLYNGCQNNTIHGNTINENSHGILLETVNDNSILNNNISFNEGKGILLDSYCYNNTISENYIDANNQTGIVLKTSSNNNLISKNTISNNIDGINIESSSNNTIENNTIQLNDDDGIKVWYDSDLNIISNNTIKNNSEYGLNLMFSDELLVYHNNIIDNNPNAQGGIESYDNGYPSGGNYWSDYNGTDDDGDGIGEIPYEIMIPGGSVNDSYPFIEENGWLKTIDVDQDAFDRGFPIRHAFDGDWAAAQSFQTSNDTLTRVDVYIRKFGTPEFNLTLEIRNGSVDGTLIESFEYPPEYFDSNWHWLNLDMDDIDNTTGKEYFIVCPPTPSGVESSFGYEWGYAFGNQYDDGSFWFTRDGGSLWRDLPTMYEFTFRTFGYS